MNKNYVQSKIQAAENALPPCVDYMEKIVKILRIAGIILGVIILIGGACTDTDIGIILGAATGIMVFGSCFISSFIIEALKEITINSYRSAEYDKIQLEISCSYAGEGFSETETNDELPPM